MLTSTPKEMLALIEINQQHAKACKNYLNAIFNPFSSTTTITAIAEQIDTIVSARRDLCSRLLIATTTIRHSSRANNASI